MNIVPGNESEEFKTAFRKTGLKVPQFAERIGITKIRASNLLYKDIKPTTEELAAAWSLVQTKDIKYSIPVISPQVPIPFYGSVSASSIMNWNDPLESTDFEFVPNEMADLRKDSAGKFIGRFCCKVVGDSMLPLLYPDDLLVFESSNVPKIGVVVIHRSDENTVTVKLLKHNGTEFVLHPLNNAYEPIPARGIVVGHLVGVIRQQGSRRTTEYDPSGIRP